MSHNATVVECPGVVAALRWLLRPCLFSSDRSVVTLAAERNILTVTSESWAVEGAKFDRCLRATRARLPTQAKQLALTLLGLGEMKARCTVELDSEILALVAKLKDVDWASVAAHATSAVTVEPAKLEGLSAGQLLTSDEISTDQFTSAVYLFNHSSWPSGKGLYGLQLIVRVITHMAPSVTWEYLHGSSDLNQSAALASIVVRELDGPAEVVVRKMLLASPHAGQRRLGLASLIASGPDQPIIEFMRSLQSQCDQHKLPVAESVLLSTFALKAALHRRSQGRQSDESIQELIEIIVENWPSEGIGDHCIEAVITYVRLWDDIPYRLALNLPRASNRASLLGYYSEQLETTLALSISPQEAFSAGNQLHCQQLDVFLSWCARAAALSASDEGVDLGKRTGQKLHKLINAGKEFVGQPFIHARQSCASMGAAKITAGALLFAAQVVRFAQPSQGAQVKRLAGLVVQESAALLRGIRAAGRSDDVLELLEARVAELVNDSGDQTLLNLWSPTGMS